MAWWLINSLLFRQRMLHLLFVKPCTELTFGSVPPQLAPGGHIGRFIIWTKSAFDRLDTLFGTASTKSGVKSGYSLPRPMMANPDVARLINSNEVQAVVRPTKVRAGGQLSHTPPLQTAHAHRLHTHTHTHTHTDMYFAPHQVQRGPGSCAPDQGEREGRLHLMLSHHQRRSKEKRWIAVLQLDLTLMVSLNAIMAQSNAFKSSLCSLRAAVMSLCF